jgi:hypothetical protein
MEHSIDSNPGAILRLRSWGKAVLWSFPGFRARPPLAAGVPATSARGRPEVVPKGARSDDAMQEARAAVRRVK